MKKNVTFSLDQDLNDRFTKVAKKHNLSKSNVVEDFIAQVVPILEAQTPNKMLSQAFAELGKQISNTGSLFDDEK